MQLARLVADAQGCHDLWRLRRALHPQGLDTHLGVAGTIEQGFTQHIGLGAPFGVFAQVEWKVGPLGQPGLVVIHDEGLYRHPDVKPRAAQRAPQPDAPLQIGGADHMVVAQARQCSAAVDQDAQGGACRVQPVLPGLPRVLQCGRGGLGLRSAGGRCGDRTQAAGAQQGQAGQQAGVSEQGHGGQGQKARRPV